MLQSGDVVYPLTRMMCAPIGDGAAAGILCAKSKVARYTTKPVWVAASLVGSGKVTFDTNDSVTRRLSRKIFEAAGIGPQDIDLIEVHDATSPSEIMFLIELGICPGEEAGKWFDEGYLDLNGRMPGQILPAALRTRGHPVGATGCGMIYEVVEQLRLEAGKRQVRDSKIGMTQMVKAFIDIDAAAMALHVFKR